MSATPAISMTTINGGIQLQQPAFPLPAEALEGTEVQSLSRFEQPLLFPNSQIAIEFEGNDLRLLSRAIVAVLNNTPVEDRTYWQRRILQTLAAAVSAATKVYFIPVSLTLPAGESFATGGVISWWCFEFYGANSTIEDIAGPKGHHELALLRKTSRNRCRTITIVTGAFAIALVSQIVYAFAAYKYNNSDQRIPAAIVTMISGSLYPTRSLQLTFEALSEKWSEHTDFEQKLISIRNNFADMIQTNRAIFVTLENKLDIVQIFNELEASNDKKAVANRFVREMISLRRRERVQVLTNGHRRTNAVSKVVGSLLAATMQSAFAYYTWTNTKEYVSDDDGVAFINSALVVGSSVYLTTKDLLATTNYLARSFFNLVSNRRELSIAEQLHPRLCFALKALGLVSDAFAQGSAWVIWGDYFGGPVCAGTFILLYAGTLYIIDRTVEEYIRRKGDPNGKAIMAVYDKLGSLPSITRTNSLIDYCYHLLDLEDDVRLELTNQAEVTRAKLESYISGSKT